MTPTTNAQIDATPPAGGTRQIADNLHIFRVPKSRFRIGNTYALLHGGRSVLIDAVHAVTRPAVDALLAQAPAAALLLTHSELIDQAFAAPDSLSEWLGGAPVLIHSMDIGMCQGILPLESNGPLLQEFGLNFFHVPAKTPGSVAYHYAASGYLFTGDILVGNNYESEAEIFSHPPIDDADWSGYAAGVAALPQNDVRYVLPLHGRLGLGPNAPAVARAAALDPENVTRE